MPAYPIEVINVGLPSFHEHEGVITELNRLQSEILFCLPRPEHRNWAAPLQRDTYTTAFVWDKLEEYRRHTKGYHPFLIAIIHGALASQKLANLFGSHDAARGLAVVTTHDWETRFAPPPLQVLLVYYFVRYTLSFICPQVKNHEESRGCFFDKKIHKQDIKLSMNAGKICDPCAGEFGECVDAHAYEAITTLVDYIKVRASAQRTIPHRPSVFIGSSTEGLPIAEHLQIGLESAADCTLWSQSMFNLTTNTLEDLLRATKQADYAILVLTPDDSIQKRGEQILSPRDNVLFELGLFMGALGRERTFIVHDKLQPPAIPSDLIGITTCTYTPRPDRNLHAALGPACTRIKAAMGPPHAPKTKPIAK